MVPGQGGNTGVLVAANGVVLVDTKLANNGQAILDQVKRSPTSRSRTSSTRTRTATTPAATSSSRRSVEIVVQENTAANMQKMPVFQEAANKHGLADRTYKDKLTVLVGRGRHRPLLLRRGAHQRRHLRGVPQRARDALGRRLRQQGAAVHRRATTAAAASRIGETLGKAAKGIPNVDDGHPRSQRRDRRGRTSWTSASSTGCSLEHARASLKAGKTPEQAMMDFKLPEKFKGYSLTRRPRRPRRQLQPALHGTEAVGSREGCSRARARGARGAALRRRRGPDAG